MKHIGILPLLALVLVVLTSTAVGMDDGGVGSYLFGGSFGMDFQSYGGGCPARSSVVRWYIQRNHAPSDSDLIKMHPKLSKASRQNRQRALQIYHLCYQLNAQEKRYVGWYWSQKKKHRRMVKRTRKDEDASTTKQDK